MKRRSLQGSFPRVSIADYETVRERKMSIFTQFVTIRCWKCDVEYGMNERAYAQRKKDGHGFFCTNGHEAAFCETEADKLRKERDRLAQRIAERDDKIVELREENERIERRRRAAAGQVTKIKNRVGHGVCPCCNRTFGNLARHMMNEHPNFTAEAAE